MKNNEMNKQWLTDEQQQWKNRKNTLNNKWNNNEQTVETRSKTTVKKSASAIQLRTAKQTVNIKQTEKQQSAKIASNSKTKSGNNNKQTVEQTVSTHCRNRQNNTERISEQSRAAFPF